jgi:hypothetical protein
MVWLWVGWSCFVLGFLAGWCVRVALARSAAQHGQLERVQDRHDPRAVISPPPRSQPRGKRELEELREKLARPA